MKFEIGETVQYLGYVCTAHNEFGEIVYIDDSKPIVIYTLKIGHGMTSHRLVYIADVREGQMKKEKEIEMSIEVDKSTLICHPFDDRTYDLIGKRVYAFEDIFKKPVVGVLQHAVYNFQRIPFRVVGDGIDKLFSFIAEYIEPEKKYRPFNNEELRGMLGTKLCMKKNYRSIVRIAKYIQDETGGAHIRFYCGFEPDAQEILDNWTFIDGSVCGVKI